MRPLTDREIDSGSLFAAACGIAGGWSIAHAFRPDLELGAIGYMMASWLAGILALGLGGWMAMLARSLRARASTALALVAGGAIAAFNVVAMGLVH